VSAVGGKFEQRFDGVAAHDRPIGSLDDRAQAADGVAVQRRRIDDARRPGQQLDRFDRRTPC
jgi:hypothetical protein